MKGALITIYGANNIGKTTHSKILVERLKEKGFKSEYMKFPRYDLEPTGDFLNKTLRSAEGQQISEEELQMWFILNRYQAQAEMKAMIEDGVIIVSEDYIGTGIAWGVSKGLDEEWLESANKFLLKEDFTMMIDGDRVAKSKEAVHVHEQNDELMRKSREVHVRLCEKYGWHKIPLQEKKEDTAKLIWNAVDDFLKGRYI